MNLAGFSLAEAAEIGQVVAGFASILALAGLYFVWKQVRLQQDDSRVELVTGMTTLIAGVDQVFIDFPDTRQYFRGFREPPPESETEGRRVRAVAMTMANVLDHVVEHQGKMNDRTRTAWRFYIRETYLESPVLREVLSANPAWWPGLQAEVSSLRSD